MSCLFDTTLLMIYLLPLLGLVLGMLPAVLVWRYSKPSRSKALNKLVTEQVNTEFTLSL